MLKNMRETQRLDTLTALRFFAAAMIVIHHSVGLFGLNKKNYPSFALDQAVSFFYVLSGFILAYVYPKLETWPEIRSFWRARIARVWPALSVSLFFVLWLLSLPWDYKTGLANLLMVNAWIPFKSYFFSYNQVSWSISTEFFFYLAFPLLIHRWEKTWAIKLLVSGGIVISLISLSNRLQLPEFTWSYEGITRTSLLYIHPASRIFEFIFGIAVFFYSRKNAHRMRRSQFRATLYEIGVILLAGASMHYVAPFAKWVEKTWAGPATSAWLHGSGSMFFFGLLIYIMAIGRGRVSSWLSHPVMVLLGEISFSLYLLHQPLLRYYRDNLNSFPHLPNSLSLAIFWVVVLLASYLMWAFIEMPGRRFILGRDRKKMHRTETMRDSWSAHFNLNRKTVSAAIILVSLLTPIYFSMGNLHCITSTAADRMTPEELHSVVGTRFGNLFALRGIKVVPKKEGLYIDLAWESLVEQKLAYTNAIHLTDNNGNILVNASYKQPITRASIKRETIWMDSVFIPKDQLKGGEKKLAIALFKDLRQLLPVDRGNRDWDGKRLIVHLEHKAA
jgi:peptidoglycan/LPS O-acetylase OafA/YrhL